MAVYAPSIIRAAQEAGLTPEEYLAQQTRPSGAGVQPSTPSPSAKPAPIFDPLTGRLYYVPAESIDAGTFFSGEAGQSFLFSLDQAGIPWKPVLTLADTLGSPAGEGGTTGVKRPPERTPPPSAPPPPPTPARATPRAAAPTLSLRRSRAGQETGSPAFAGTRSRLDFGGFDPNPLSIRTPR